MSDQQNNSDSSAADASASAITLAAGTKIGKYEIERLIGSSGQSVVYLGRDNLLDRSVAIKQISSALAADERFLKRFRAEAKILAQLGTEGGGIVSVYDLLENETGVFIVMEYVDGRTLKDILQYQKYALPADMVVKILLSVAQGLKIAHTAGIVHRDIKPGNIMVSRNLDARIMDFGVAARSGEDDSLSLGTTKYMAPEVFKGSAVDCRSDIYSLGIMAYEMLTGREFFDKIFADVISDKRTENLRWMKWHCDEKVNAQPLSSVNLLICKQLSDVVARMMAKDIKDRYEDIDQMSEALEEALQANANIDVESARQATDENLHVRSEDLDSQSSEILSDAAENHQYYDDEPTTKIPVSSEQKKKYLILTLVLVVVVLAGGIFMAVRQEMARRDRLDAARTQWSSIGQSINQALSQYEKGDIAQSQRYFEQADQQLADYMATYGDLREGTARARSWQLLAKSNVAMMDNDVDLASDLFAEATDGNVLNSETQEKYAARLSVRTAALAYLDSLERALAVDDFAMAEQARVQLNSLRMPPKDLDLRQQQLFKRLDDSKQNFEFNRAVTSGVEATEIAYGILRGSELQLFNQAEMYLNEAEKHYRQAATIDPGERVTEYRQQLEQARIYMSARAEYLKAISRNVDLDEQIRLAQLVVDARPSEPASTKLLNRLLAQRHYKNAEAQMDSAQQGPLESALASLKEAVRLNETSQYTQAMAAVEKRLARIKLLNEATRLRQEGDYIGQLDVLRQLSDVEGDEDLAQMIEDATVEAFLQKAQQLQRERQWDGALDEYEKARKVRLNDGRLASRIDAMVALLGQQKRAYRSIDDCADLINSGDYDKAVRNLRTILDTGAKINLDLKEAEQLMDEAIYRANIVRARKLLSMKEPEDAMIYLNVASRKKDTEEVRSLIAQAQKMIQELEEIQQAQQP